MATFLLPWLEIPYMHFVPHLRTHFILHPLTPFGPRTLPGGACAPTSNYTLLHPNRTAPLTAVACAPTSNYTLLHLIPR